MSEEKQYAERDIMELDEAGNHYIRHVDHMTREKLHSKSDIAAELGWRDMQIAELKAQRDALAAEIDQQADWEDAVIDALESSGIIRNDVTFTRTLLMELLKENLRSDAYLNSVRADAIESVVDALASSGALTVGDSIVEVVKLAEGLRAGKDGE